MRNTLLGFGLGLAAASLLSGLPAAQSVAMEHEGHGAHGALCPEGEGAPQNEATRAYRAANAEMHRAMCIAFTGDADKDFVRGMIPHHQGAIDMAKIVLAHGKDPEIRALAEGIIKAQEAEIAQMKTIDARLSAH